MKDKELVKMFNPMLKMKKILLLFLSMEINELKCIGVNIGLDTFILHIFKSCIIITNLFSTNK